MYPFIETIRIENGIAENIAYHNERLNRTRRNFWKDCELIDLSIMIHPDPHEKRVLKCRVVYEEEINEITYTPYILRNVSSIRIVFSDSIDYTYKSADRGLLNQLYALRKDADDVLIVRNNLLTDTSIANIALFNGTEWHTPTSALLKGTRRALLLDQKIIKEKDIYLKDISNYSRITLFNAMIDFKSIEIPIDQAHILL